MTREGALIALLLALSACRSEPVSTDVRTVSAKLDPSREVLSASTGPVTGAPTCDDRTTVVVPGAANVFGAGIDEPPAPGGGGGGVAPACVLVPTRASAVTVPWARGSLSFTPLRAPDVHLHKCPGGVEAVLAYGADGNSGGCPGDIPGGTILPAGVVSGIASRGRAGFLVGVFLPEHRGGGAPPATLDFEDRFDFDRLTPRPGQLFFIGDGRTGDGRLQVFRIPTGATKLFLGIADAFDFRGPPGAYDDNHGRFRVRIRFV